MRLELYIPGEPIAQPRARATGFGGHARMYTPTKNGIADYKAAIRLVAAEAYKGPLIDGPVICHCSFIFSRPKRLLTRKAPVGRVPMLTRRDRDNLDKAVLDALTGVLWKDDKIVYAGYIEKMYAATEFDEQPHTKLVIETREDQSCPHKPSV